MKIIRLSTFLDFGGVETRLANVSHVRDENEWVFMCLNREGKAADKIKENGKRIINLSAKPTIYSLATFRKVLKAVREERPEVIHTSGAEANFHGIFAAKIVGVKKIIGEEIGTPSHSFIARNVFSLIYRFADYVVGNSQHVLNAVHQFDKVPFNKLVRIDNPIIFREIGAQVNSDQSLFKLLMISRLEPVKNIEAVINVVSQLKRENLPVRLTIAGSGTLEQKLRQKVKAMELEKEIEFVGFISDPYPYLLNSDLYVLNSFTEGFSNSLVEAMYSKTPSLSTSVGAAPEIIVDGENGFLIPANDENALLQKIKSIMQLSSEERKEIGEKGKKTITGNFSLEKHIAELMKIYKN